MSPRPSLPGAAFYPFSFKPERKAGDLYRTGAEAAATYLTDLTRTRMERGVKMYRDLRATLITKFTNNAY